MRAIYSNALEEEQATAVRSHLMYFMGFHSIENKETISLYVNDDSRIGHVISFINVRCTRLVLISPGLLPPRDGYWTF